MTLLARRGNVKTEAVLVYNYNHPAHAHWIPAFAGMTLLTRRGNVITETVLVYNYNHPAHAHWIPAFGTVEKAQRLSF